MNKTHYFNKLNEVSNLGAKFNYRLAQLQGLVDSIMRMQDDNLFEELNNLCADLEHLHYQTWTAVVDKIDKTIHNTDDPPSPTTNNE